MRGDDVRVSQGVETKLSEEMFPHRKDNGRDGNPRSSPYAICNENVMDYADVEWSRRTVTNQELSPCLVGPDIDHEIHLQTPVN